MNRTLVVRIPQHKLFSGFLSAVICTQICLMWQASSGAEPPVTAIAIAPDGQSVVVGSQAGLAVHGWPELKRQKKLDTALVNVHELEFSPNGQSLAIAGGTPAEEGLVQVLAWPSGKSLYILNGHEDSVLDIAWKSDSVLVTASLDHEVAVWDVQSQKPVQLLKGHSRGVSALCFLTQEKLLVTGGIDQNLHVWNAESAKIVRTLNNHTRKVHDLALRPSMTGLPMIASVSDDRTVRLWQPTIGRMVRFAKLNTIPLAVAWIPDGSQVAVSAADGHVRLIDPDTVEIIRDFPTIDGWAYSLRVHPSDGSLIVGGRNGQLKRIVYDAE